MGQGDERESVKGVWSNMLAIALS